MPPPVLVQAGFELEPLAGEAGIEGRRAGDCLRAAEGEPCRLPDRGLRPVGHQDRAVEVGQAIAVGHRRHQPRERLPGDSRGQRHHGSGGVEVARHISITALLSPDQEISELISSQVLWPRRLWLEMHPMLSGHNASLATEAQYK